MGDIWGEVTGSALGGGDLIKSLLPQFPHQLSERHTCGEMVFVPLQLRTVCGGAAMADGEGHSVLVLKRSHPHYPCS